MTWRSEGGATAFPQADAALRSMRHLRQHLQGVVTQHRGSWQFPLCSSQCHKPISPCTTLVCSALPPPEHRVSGCESGAVCGPFKRVPEFLADSHTSLVDRNTFAFHSQVLRELLFQALELWAVGSSLVLRSHTYQGEAAQI